MTEGFTKFKDTNYKIWYRVAKSDIPDSSTPILLLHGGPGLGSDYLEPLETLAEQGRTVIRFDQLGSGRSDRPRDLSIWTIEGCISQIDSIRDALGLDRIHLLGHSWGGMVALEYLRSRPFGGPKRYLVQFGGQRSGLVPGSASASSPASKLHRQGSGPVREILSSTETARAGRKTNALYDSRGNRPPGAAVESWVFAHFLPACQIACLPACLLDFVPSYTMA